MSDYVTATFQYDDMMSPMVKHGEILSIFCDFRHVTTTSPHHMQEAAS